MSRRPTLVVYTCTDCDDTIEVAVRVAHALLPAEAPETRVAEMARALADFVIGTIRWPSRACH